MPAVSADGEDCLIRIWAKPRASQSRVLELREDQVEVQLAAPPVDGAANERLVEFLSKQLKVSKSRVRLEKGESSRSKLIRVRGLSVVEAKNRLFPSSFEESQA